MPSSRSMPEPKARSKLDAVSLQSQTYMSARVSRHPNLSRDTVRVCHIWLSSHSGSFPSDCVISGISLAFGSSFDAVRQWFKRHVEEEDSGYHSMRPSMSDITSPYERNRNKCTRKSSDDSNDRFDAERPYHCTSRCGAKFKTKDDWGKHEEINYPQKLWYCRLLGCASKSLHQRVSFRKEHFKVHLKKRHAREHVDQEEIKASCLPIKSQFSKKCLFQGCSQKLSTWKDRIDHLAKHFSKEWDGSRWRPTADDDVDNENYEKDAVDTDDEASDFSSSDSPSDNDSSDSDTSDDGKGGSGSFGTSGNGSGFSTDNMPDSGRQPKPRPGRGSQNRQGAAEGSRSQYKNQNQRPYSSFTVAEESKEVIRNQQLTFRRGRFFKWFGPTPKEQHEAPRYLAIHFVRLLGSGATAIVDEMRYLGKNTKIARKTFRHSSLDQKDGFEREVHALSRLRHPHIVSLLAAYWDTKSLAILVEPVADYDMLSYLKLESPKLSLADIRPWFNCLISGLCYMHTHQVIHGDIKPANILIKDYRVFYADFGLSRLSSDKSLDPGCATFRYAAPEFQNGLRGKAYDIWSLGCVFLELLSFHLQYSIDYLLRGQRGRAKDCLEDKSYSANLDAVQTWFLKLRKSVSEHPEAPDILKLLDCCQAMLRKEPNQRPSAAELSRYFAPRSCCVQIPKSHSCEGSIPQAQGILTTSTELRRHRSCSGNSSTLPSIPEDWRTAYSDVPGAGLAVSRRPSGSVKGFLSRSIPEATYTRPSPQRLKCTQCDDYPDGFRGDHELRRHLERQHQKTRKVWVCIDVSPDKTRLANCKCCKAEKEYRAYYNAAAHLRRVHFSPKPKDRKGKSSQEKRRGGEGGGEWPPIGELMKWIEEREEHRGEYRVEHRGEYRVEHRGEYRVEHRDEHSNESESQWPTLSTALDFGPVLSEPLPLDFSPLILPPLIFPPLITLTHRRPFDQEMRLLS